MQCRCGFKQAVQLFFFFLDGSRQMLTGLVSMLKVTLYCHPVAHHKNSSFCPLRAFIAKSKTDIS